MLLEGRITVNGIKITELGSKIDPNSDQVSVDGKNISVRPPLVYWMLNKPDLCLTSRKPEPGKKTIFELPALKQLKFLLYPIGRLDYRTEGLLLLSNDGELVHRLTHPRFKVPRTYQALVQRKLTQEEEYAITHGFTLDDGPVQGVEIKFIQSTDLGQSRGAWYLLTVKEGRNRLVRRIFEKFDIKVVRLFRYSYGDLHLPESLKPGEYKQLSSEEIQLLKKAVELD